MNQYDTTLVKLPSRGKLYPPDHSLHDKDSVEIKYMTSVEEDILTSPSLLKKGIVFDELIRSCLVDKTIDPDSLLIGDRNSILITLRVTGYGNEYKVSLLCNEPECGKKFDYEFDLSSLTYKFLDDKSIEVPFVNEFSVILPVSKKKVGIKILTEKDDKEITQLENRTKQLMPNVLFEKRVTNRLMKEIVSIDESTDTNVIAKFVSNIRVKDSYTIRKKINEIRPDIDMQKEAECPHCGSISKFDIPVSIEFFWPSL